MLGKRSLTLNCLAAVALSMASNEAAAARVLVIGNDAYTHVRQLSNAGNDARLMASALKAAGFEVVGGVRTNLDRKAMWKALDQLQVRIAKGDDVVFYYQVLRDGINLVEVQDEMKSARFALMVIDACRNNPFSAQAGKDAWHRRACRDRAHRTGARQRDPALCESQSAGTR